ncbi:hypothetical protein HBI26_079250 [Parastagonospora nodorum]|nr:hypothetical protein HBH42_049100 [Parastagonospora nodorum]KAH4912561.1 hypothetical protein HBI80_010290 [Parastagonospora nodorum]KAH5336513.1 hypothetical protein HBI12_027620 [Parastagonospora nodorum]KAH5440128.1 hypothetical protein HBI32_002840 [Parastagonospora nodorum]KAH5601454.1 hypothetical protein HBI26_079250 [Parastagonospora nodorum]
MLGLFFFLPSPTIPPHQRDAYVQQKLESGSTVITAIDYSLFRNDPVDIRAEVCYECSDLLLHWRFFTYGQTAHLALSDQTDRTFDIAKILKDAFKWNKEGMSSTGDQSTPYFEFPLVLKALPAGDADEEISMPWFHTTDQKLMHYNMHNFLVSIVAYAVVPEPDVLEIWRGAFVQHALDSRSGQVDDQYNSNLGQVAYDNMTLHKSDTELLASFAFKDGPFAQRVVVRHLSGSLPSRTYPIRRALLVPLGPFIAIPFIIVNEFIEALGPILSYTLVLVSLLAALAGYRKFRISRWRQSDSRSRSMNIWGPTGPVEPTKQRDWLNEEKDIGLQRPKTMRVGRSWRN